MDGEVDCGGPLDLPASGDHRPVRKADRVLFRSEGQSRACPHPAVPRRCDASPDDVPAQRGASMESLEKAPLAVIMVNWRSAEDTIECLESLMHSQQPMRLIVCDNQSGDGSVEKILAWARGERPVEPKSATLAHLTRPPVPKPVEHVVLNRQQAEEGDVTSSRLIIIKIGGAPV